jgi:hypothetical protein
MQEILQGLRFGPVPEFLTNEVFDRFDIMVGRCLYPFHPFGIVDRKIVDDVVQTCRHSDRQQVKWLSM